MIRTGAKNMSQKQVASRFEEVLEESTLAISVSVEQDDYSCRLDVYSYSFIDDDQVSAVVYSCNGKELIRVYVHDDGITVENVEKNELIEIKLTEIPEYPLASTKYFARLAQPRSIMELEAYLKDYISDIVSAYLDVIARP
jgi:hypothetical protein